MSKNEWEETLNNFKEEIASIRGLAEVFYTQFEKVWRQAESLKAASLGYVLEERIRSLARTRGYTSVLKDKKRLGTSLGASMVGSLLAGIITRDKLTAFSAGLSTFDAAIRASGETNWAVSLEKDLKILPRDNIKSGKIWVTWESLKGALTQLEREASNGIELGNLDSIISRLQKCKELVYISLPEARPIWLKVKEP